MRRPTLLILLCLVAIPAQAALTPEQAAENQPVTPFRIIGDVYYVGASDVASYLISTPGGLILLDGGFAQTAPQIERNIRRVGFEPSAVKILLNGHAHPDHAGGLAALKRDTGAQFYAMDAEVMALEHDGQGTFYPGDRKLFDSVHVDRVLHDGDTVSLGGVTLTAHLTAGHTPGCTTWTMRAEEGGSSLGEHGHMFDLKGKLARLTSHPASNPFIDPVGCRRFVEQSEAEFEAALAQQRGASSP